MAPLQLCADIGGSVDCVGCPVYQFGKVVCAPLVCLILTLLCSLTLSCSCRCITGCVYFAIWTKNNMRTSWYLGVWSSLPYPPEYDPSSPGFVGLTNFVTAFILYGACMLSLIPSHPTCPHTITPDMPL